MPKASKDFGSIFAQVVNAGKVPGPEYYNKTSLNEPFSKKARGGQFSKLARDWRHATNKSPAVGQYDTICQACSPRIPGGIMPKTERRCYPVDKAKKLDTPAPGKYNAEKPESNRTVPNFSHHKNESRNPQKPPAVGPGYYKPNYEQTQVRIPSYSNCKEASTSYLDRLLKGKDKTPAPGHHGIPEAKNNDRLGQCKHVQRLLGDRQVTPRQPRRPGSAPVGMCAPRRRPPGARSTTPRAGPGDRSPGLETPTPTPRMPALQERPGSVQASTPRPESVMSARAPRAQTSMA